MDSHTVTLLGTAVAAATRTLHPGTAFRQPRRWSFTNFVWAETEIPSREAAGRSPPADARRHAARHRACGREGAGAIRRRGGLGLSRTHSPACCITELNNTIRRSSRRPQGLGLEVLERARDGPEHEGSSGTGSPVPEEGPLRRTWSMVIVPMTTKSPPKPKYA